jgi:Spy/CpxP family protein refolding chaperone
LGNARRIFKLKRAWKFVVAAVAIVALPALAAGQMMGGPMMGHGQMMMHGGGMPPFPMFLRAARLTPDQRKQVDKILSENRETFHQLFEQMHQTREEMANKLLSPGNVTAKDLEPETQKLDQLHQQMMANSVKVALEIRAVLKPDQIKRVAEFHQKMKSLHEQMRDLMKQMGPEPGEGPTPPSPPAE